MSLFPFAEEAKEPPMPFCTGCCSDAGRIDLAEISLVQVLTDSEAALDVVRESVSSRAAQVPVDDAIVELPPLELAVRQTGARLVEGIRPVVTAIVGAQCSIELEPIERMIIRVDVAEHTTGFGGELIVVDREERMVQTATA